MQEEENNNQEDQTPDQLSGNPENQIHIQPPQDSEKKPLTLTPKDPPAEAVKKPQAKPQPDTKAKLAVQTEMQEFLKLLGRVLSSADLYGLDHNMTVDSLEQSYELLAKLLENADFLDLNMVENQLFANSTPLETKKNPLISAFADRLKTLNIAGFRLTKGMSADEYVRLLLLLTSRGEQTETSFADALSESGLEHVSAKTSTIQVVEEGEVVVSEDELGGDGDGGYDEPSVKQIVAFLKGDGSADKPSELQDIDQAANNADKLADLIMEAVTIRQRGADMAGGESLGDLVVGCLRRTFDGLSAGKQAKTKKGKKQLGKALAVLEKNMLDKLRAHAGENYEQAAAEVAAAADAMQDEIKIDSITSEYLKKRAAAEQSEERILRMMKARGTENLDDVALKEKLLAGGLGGGDWQKLVVESGIQDMSAGAAGSDMGMLASVLEQFTTVMENIQDLPDPQAADEKADATIEKVKDEVNSALATTEAKIKKLAKAKDDSSVENMLGLLPEIVQELCQPLSVINCTIDMLSGQSFGTISESGLKMLELATDSGGRLQSLINRLAGICGMPDSLSPDAEKLDTIYKKQ
ncbi:MAG: hypothetical protein KAH23_09815 [Kiritimatiellae bacterium]|nr:hypothetical protein [Kiritimatiellia bacterium]